MYLRDKSAETIACAARLKQKLQITFALSFRRSIMTLEYTLKQKWKCAGHMARMKDQALPTVVIKEWKEIKGMTTQKMSRRHNKEGGSQMEQESNRG